MSNDYLICGKHCNIFCSTLVTILFNLPACISCFIRFLNSTKYLRSKYNVRDSYLRFCAKWIPSGMCLHFDCDSSMTFPVLVVRKPSLHSTKVDVKHDIWINLREKFVVNITLLGHILTCFVIS